MGDEVRAVAAPELTHCETFSERVAFDHAALALAADADEVWPLVGSDPVLVRLLMHEQTVLQGPHTDALTGAAAARLEELQAAPERWPLLSATGAFAGIPYRTLLVVPVGYDPTIPPIGTFAVARNRELPFTAHETAEVIRFATLVAGLLMARWQQVRDVDLLDGLVRDQRHLAAGILASFLGTTTGQALAIMRARAFHDNQTLAEFATEVVTALGTSPGP